MYKLNTDFFPSRESCFVVVLSQEKKLNFWRIGEENQYKIRGGQTLFIYFILFVCLPGDRKLKHIVLTFLEQLVWEILPSTVLSSKYP